VEKKRYSVFGIHSRDVQQIPKRRLARWIRNLKNASGISNSQPPPDARPIHSNRYLDRSKERDWPYVCHDYMAISACSFRSSSSSASSSVCTGALTDDYVSHIFHRRERLQNLLSTFAAAGNLCISSDTGTVPVFSILLSSCSCSSSASSSSKADSSIGSPIGALVIALAISSPKACCSRSFSL
jgi:hypothetical protein